MAKIQLLTFIKKPAFILSLICLVFFLKGVFLAILFPFINGQDEAKHYNTVQFLAEPAEKNWTINSVGRGNVNNYFFDFNVTEEIKETAKAIDYDNLRHKLNNTQSFTGGYLGERENEINSKRYSQVNKDYPPAQVKNPHLYHYIGAQIEKLFSGDSVFTRFYAARIYSVLLGSLCILLFYFIAKKAGLSPKSSLLISAIAAFHPMLAQTSSIITYDILLILAFALFTLSGVLILKKGPGWMNISLLLASLFIGIMAKGTALVLVGPTLFLFLYLVYQKSKSKNKIRFFAYAVSALIIFAVIFNFAAANYINIPKFASTIFHDGIGQAAHSLDLYIDKSFGGSRFSLASKTYWISMVNFIKGDVMDKIITAIWTVDIAAVAGLIWLLLFKKNVPPYLPEKKYVIFFLVMILALQAGVRFADWRFFIEHNSVEFSTSGRYYLPNLISHLILVATGIGFLLKKEKFLEIFLALALIAMFISSAYLIFIGIIPRFYF